MTGSAPEIADGRAAISIVPVQHVDLRLVPRSWRFADERRREIDAFFAERQRERTGLWNGRVLLLHRFELTQGMFRGDFFETDYAAFHAWSYWNFPDNTVKNCFAAGALCTADGAFVLGEMGSHTANAGDIYFPCGTPDPDDVNGSRVDFDSSVRRELAEEIGLGEDDYVAAPGWFVVHDGPRVALIRLLQAHERADALCRRIEEYLAREAVPELARIHIVRSPADFDQRIATFVTAFLSHLWNAS